MNTQCSSVRPNVKSALATAIMVMNLSALASGQVPRLFNYQAQLAGYGDTSVHLEVEFWTLSTGGASLFYEDRGLVTLDDGVFALQIGSTHPGGIPDSAVNSAAVWLELTVDGTALSRTRLVTVPFAIKSISAELLTIPGLFTPAVTVDASGNVGVNSKVELGKANDKGYMNLLQSDGDHGIELDGQTSSGGGLVTVRGQTDPSALIWGADPAGGGGALVELKYNGEARVRIDAQESSPAGGAAMSMLNSSGLDTLYFDADLSDAAFIGLKGSDGTTGVLIWGDGTQSSGQISLNDASGNATIVMEGDTSPGAVASSQLTLQQASGVDGVVLRSDNTAGGNVDVYDKFGNKAIALDAENSKLVLGGTAASAAAGKLEVVNDGDVGVTLSVSSSSSVLGALHSSGAQAYMTADSGGGRVFLRDSNGDIAIDLDAYDGRVKAKVIEITGADLAERFLTSEAVEPGMVVAIDPQRTGQLCLARGEYNRCVAGVVSGANGLPAGTIMGNLPGHGEAPPVALSGRVWVNCDAASGSIQPGDMLTTSSTAGYAMRVSDFTRAQGAIVGKAMSALESGRGMVLVLVNLQ